MSTSRPIKVVISTNTWCWTMQMVFDTKSCIECVLSACRNAFHQPPVLRGRTLKGDWGPPTKMLSASGYRIFTLPSTKFGDGSLRDSTITSWPWQNRLLWTLEKKNSTHVWMRHVRHVWSIHATGENMRNLANCRNGPLKLKALVVKNGRIPMEKIFTSNPGLGGSFSIVNRTAQESAPKNSSWRHRNQVSDWEVPWWIAILGVSRCNQLFEPYLYPYPISISWKMDATNLGTPTGTWDWGRWMAQGFECWSWLSHRKFRYGPWHGSSVSHLKISGELYTIKVRFESFQDKLGHLKSRLTKPLGFSRSVSVTVSLYSKSIFFRELLRGWNPMRSTPKPQNWVDYAVPPSQKQLIVIIQSNLRSKKNSSIRTVCGKTGKSPHCQNMALEKKNSSHSPSAPSPSHLPASGGQSPRRTRSSSPMGKKPCENQERLRVRSLGWIAKANG